MSGVRISANQHIQQYFIQVIETLIHSKLIPAGALMLQKGLQHFSNGASQKCEGHIHPSIRPKMSKYGYPKQVSQGNTGIAAWTNLAAISGFVGSGIKYLPLA